MAPRPQNPTELAAPCSARRVVLVALCALGLPWTVGSCAFHHPGRAAAASEASATARVTVETRIGVVRALGADQRFVLIEAPSALAASILSEGQLLRCRLPGSDHRTVSADLRVSRERHQSLIVANVVAGEPAIGAVVYSTPEAASASIPSPDSISSVTTAPLPGLFPPRKP